MGDVCREGEVTEGAKWRIPEAGWALGWDSAQPVVWPHCVFLSKDSARRLGVPLGTQPSASGSRAKVWLSGFTQCPGKSSLPPAVGDGVSVQGFSPGWWLRFAQSTDLQRLGGETVVSEYRNPRTVQQIDREPKDQSRTPAGL